MRSHILMVALASTALSFVPLTAQDPTEIHGVDTIGVPVRPEFHPAVPIADIPIPPRVLVGVTPPHTTPPIPNGQPVPGPNTPPSADVSPDVQAPLAGVFKYFQNEVVKPTGTSTSSTGEPSVGLAQDTVFQTGNWYSARSIDNGQNWTYISPYSRFPAIDGGFCCDQRVYYIASHDITVWLLQYSYSASTQRGSYRIAVANGRPDLAAGTTGSWVSWVFSPDGNFGFAAGNWLDFPDIAQGGTWLYASANVFDAAGNYTGSVVWRMDIADLVAHSALSYAYVTNSSIGASTYRFANRPSSDDRVYFAAFNTTTDVYVYYYTNTGTWSRVSRTVGSWTNATASCPGPDGLDWCGRVVGRFRGAFSTPSEIGFVWTSAGNGGTRPLPYTRIARFTADTNRNLIAEQDLWSSTLTWAYGTGRGTTSSDVGMVFAVGGPSSYVHSSATIFDNYQPFGGAVTTYGMNSGTNGPSSNRWGDYFDVHVHPTFTRSFIATGMAQNGGTSGSFNDPRYVWFGRDDYEPTWVNLAVTSTPITGVGITLSVEDLDGLKDGTTNFSRRYAPQQGYAVTAPTTVVSGSTTYAFERWSFLGSLQPIGETTYSTTSIGFADDAVEARYLVRRTLTVQSINPNSGVSVTVSPADINSLANGSTAFTRYYRSGDSVSLTAPTAIGPDPFRYWTLNGVPQTAGQNAISVSMTGDRTAVAVYWDFLAGSWSSIGAGCVGGNRLIPSQTVLQAGNQYVQGSPMTWRCINAPSSVAGIVMFGFSNRTWLGLRLPVDLSFIGGNGCVLYHDIVATENVGSSAAGVAALTLTIPVEPGNVGVPIYTTFTFLDALAPRALPLTFSNAVQLIQGGNH